MGFFRDTDTIRQRRLSGTGLDAAGAASREAEAEDAFADVVAAADEFSTKAAELGIPEHGGRCPGSAPGWQAGKVRIVPGDPAAVVVSAWGTPLRPCDMLSLGRTCDTPAVVAAGLIATMDAVLHGHRQ